MAQGATFVDLRPANSEDMDWAVTLESRKNFSKFIDRWPRADHVKNLKDPDKRYFIIENEKKESLGFLVLGGIRSKARSIELVRLVLASPTPGIVSLVLQKSMKMVFDQLSANRFWLDVFEENVPAREIYKKYGFKEEGIMKEARMKPSGELGSLVIMALLLREYRAKQRASAA